MSFFEFFSKAASITVASMGRTYYLENRNKNFGGMKADQWDTQWKSIGMLKNVQGNISYLNKSVGLYRAKLHGKVVYIGRAVEYNNGGLRKRLTDYVRESGSSRGTNSSSNMNRYKDQLSIDVLVVGEGAEAAALTKELEKMLIGKHQPEWNKLGK